MESPKVTHKFSIGYAEVMKELLDSCGYNGKEGNIWSSIDIYEFKKNLDRK